MKDILRKILLSRIFRKFIILLLICFAIVYRFFFSMAALPKGELISSIESPNGKYTINAYIARGGATVADSIRGEVVYSNSIRPRKNIYWQYRQDTANIIWLDSTTVEINGIKLDVRKDVYDFRRHK